MAVQWKLGWARGQVAKDVTQAAGTAITGHDAMELNIDVGTMTQGEVVLGLEALMEKVLQSPFPAA